MARGRIGSKDGHLDAKIDWNADHLAAVQRPDLLLVLTGQGGLAYQAEHATLTGQLRVDRGHVELHAHDAPALGDDVVVAGRKAENTKTRVLSSTIDLTVDLGPGFTVAGQGLDARVAGKLRLASPGHAPITAHGDISVVRGTYQAYGRKLDIEKGTLYFAGPLDNPGLQIRAMRKNQQVEAGVEITGTAK